MTDRVIKCAGCGEYLGVIRDAKLKKGMVYLCSNCNIKRVASDLAKKTGSTSMPPGFEDIFGGFK